MDNIKQERSNKRLNSKLNKRLKYTSRNNKFGTQVKKSMAFHFLKK